MKLNKDLDKSLELLDKLLDSYSNEELRKEVAKHEQNIGITIREYFFNKELHVQELKVKNFVYNYLEKFISNSVNNKTTTEYKYANNVCYSRMVAIAA